MPIDKQGNGDVTALAIQPRNWEPVIGLIVVLTLAILAPLLYLVAASIRASSVPGVG